MSNNSCFSDESFFSNDSEFNYIPDYEAIESEITTQSGEMEIKEDNIEVPNLNEPLAYRKQKEMGQNINKSFKRSRIYGKWYVTCIFSDFSDHIHV